MGSVGTPFPVKLVCPVLAGKEKWLSESMDLLESQFGPSDLASDIWPFNSTDYYEPEMGEGLLRQIFSFKNLVSPDEIARIKHATNELEQKLTSGVSEEIGRAINIDPGYVAESKMVLATTKDYTHRIYLEDGIYAEVTLRWQHGEFKPWDWTYPDYRTAAYRQFFADVRKLYRQQLQSIRKGKAPKGS